MGIRIRGTGRYLPEKILTNADFEKMVDTTDEWITTRTGIKERHIADDSTTTSDMAANAARAALENAGMEANELDLILISTVTPDHPFPNTASIVQYKLGISSCMCFDIEAACSGLLYAIDIAHSMIKCGKHKKVLVVGAEKLSTITDYTDRSTCVLFGDAASAVILEATDDDNDFYVCSEVSANGA